MNFLEVTVGAVDDHSVTVHNASLDQIDVPRKTRSFTVGQTATLGIRPQYLHPADKASGKLIAALAKDTVLAPGTVAHFEFDPNQTHIFSRDKMSKPILMLDPDWRQMAEPVPKDASIRSARSAILSPHRAAAVDKGRQLTGDMILSDLKAVQEGRPAQMLSRANQDTIAALAGIGDAKAVSDLALDR